MYRSRQCGAVLIVSLLILLVMTMLVISAIQGGTINMRVVDNMRAEQDARAVARLAVDEVLSNVNNFDPDSPPSSVTIEGDFDGDGDGTTTVPLTAVPTCVHTRPAEGYSAIAQIAPEDTSWQFEVSYQTPDGARATISQGVQIRMTAGTCS